MYNTIVVGTNGSSSARGAVTRAAQLAKLSGARLLVVAAYKDGGGPMLQAMAGQTAPPAAVDARTQVATMLSELAVDLERESISVETFPYPGGAVQALLEIAEGEDADLIVVGNKGMQGARRYLGSVPSNVAHQASCSVLIVNTTG